MTATATTSKASSSRILVVDDEMAFRRALRTSLTARSFEVTEAATGGEGVVAVADGPPDLVLLDLGLPDIDGMEVLERIRGFSQVPVIALTARDDQRSKVGALDAGADDYVTKPFDTDELVARVRASLRRRTAEPEPTRRIIVDGLTFDLGRQLVERNGERVALTRTELRLLEAMVANPGRLLTHEWLLRRVWGPGYGTESNYLRTYIGQLRKKLGDDAANPRLILTEPGIGYRWIGTED